MEFRSAGHLAVMRRLGVWLAWWLAATCLSHFCIASKRLKIGYSCYGMRIGKRGLPKLSSGTFSVTLSYPYSYMMKLFRSNNIEIIAECRRYFQFNIPSELVEKKLNSKITITDVFYTVFQKKVHPSAFRNN